MRIVGFLLVLLTVFGCDGPEPRKPVQRKSSSYFKESIERSRKLLEAEEKRIQQIIKNDSLKHYTHSASGSWYYYLRVNDSTDYTPQTDDIVTLTYNLLTLDNDTLYSESELGTLSYRVDKQELFLGLRDAIKLLKKNEKATFLFPSSIAFGYHGDNNKIGTNVPLKSTITILNIEKQQDNLEE
ncbi:gliding motility-associated peptidyl-prolyl isomerase GldI [Maribacter cobaltidurans]|uniref:Peptidyl-prolyl cis-trans isomerase n=1 Tax=Maribacter cobaltidurans TaxID=1178778 RepID=A0A223V185_9FLAO|nr:gliding motility-associated peptidyl-prolyl isomerase GldI [Maribacter cobaltidurans]ASV28910.1 gliding motility-associated peptidyl-prolyl isomerase GldI [Maribacter cobaltidurans]GGD73785.1 peptidyl-prolyl cis-trans isomerase [Maribacter cobaltidurans]